jgi:hypothetical protein
LLVNLAAVAGTNTDCRAAMLTVHVLGPITLALAHRAQERGGALRFLLNLRYASNVVMCARYVCT